MVVVCDALVCRIACGIHDNVTIKMVSHDDEIEKHFELRACSFVQARSSCCYVIIIINRSEYLQSPYCNTEIQASRSNY